MLLRNMVPCQSREAVVIVRSYHNGIMDGWLQHPHLERNEKIQSLSQLILLLNGLVDLEGSMKQPMPFVAAECSGEQEKAVFRVQILFREHHTWQGKLIWQNENQEVIFHSGIELMQLFDEILAE